MISPVRGRFERLFPRERLFPVDRVERMGKAFDALDHQRPATCGAYALSYLFPALDMVEHEGHSLEAEDYLAHLAAVAVEDYEVQPSLAISRRVADGELSEAQALQVFGKAWYRYPVRSSSDPVESGTSPTGVARAITIGSSGRLSVVPVPARLADGEIQLTAARWGLLLDGLAERVDDWRWHAIFNYETDRLLRPNDASFTPENLRAADSTERIPRDDWGVGHFVGLAGLWRMGGAGPWWLLLFDTYKERGFDGYQPQPAELMRQGIVRSDGREGGVLLILPAEKAVDALNWLNSLGIDARMWSNGSLEPVDWTWTSPAGNARNLTSTGGTVGA